MSKPRPYEFRRGGALLYPSQIPRVEDIDDLKGEVPRPTTRFRAEEIDADDENWSSLFESEIPRSKLPFAA